MTALTWPPAGEPAESARPRLEHLDGIRGLAALYVVVHHAAGEVAGPLWGPLEGLRAFFAYGHFAVAVFIVLSGYCLMLPVARSQEARLSGGFLRYLGRRARRILPPYFMALALCLLAIALVPALSETSDPRWEVALPAFQPRVVASHLLLVHNLRPSWALRIDPPMWSVATEWQIYLAFPALLLVWRKFGTIAAVTAGFALGEVFRGAAMAVGGFDVRSMSPHYLGLFALGMMGTAIGVARDPRLGACEGRLPWTALSVLLVGLGVLADTVDPDRKLALPDAFVGAGAACLIVACRRDVGAGAGAERSYILRLFGSRAAVGLGMFSYSLYLVHYPLLSLIHHHLMAWQWGPTARLAGLTIVGTSVSILTAYLFHRAFERPFMKGPASAEPRHRVTVAAPAMRSGGAARPPIGAGRAPC